MRNYMLSSVSATFLFLTACAAPSTFENNGSQPVSQSEFGVLRAQPDVYQGRAIRMAGRIVGVESTAEGTMVTAEWLPYPQTEYEGPDDSGMVVLNRFVLFYPGKIDQEGSLHGNKFLVIGKKEGTQSLVNIGGTYDQYPFIAARCLHVWKTGDAAIETQPDVENTGYPVFEETYCSKT